MYCVKTRVSTCCHSSVGLRMGNRILDELQSAETEFLKNRIYLDWHSAATLQGWGSSPDGLWAISNADGKGMGSMSSSTGTWQWRLTWAILYVAACINSDKLRSVKRSLTHDSRCALATAFIASRIDYCNSVLYGVAKGKVQLLQMVLNAAARLVVGTGKFSHVTPILHDVLHWLPVQHRISYKIAILARNCIHGIGPAYFGDVFRSGDCSPWTNQPVFSDAWRSCDPSNPNKIKRTEFPYIRTDGVELTPWFAQAFCYKPRTFPKRTENIPV